LILLLPYAKLAANASMDKEEAIIHASKIALGENCILDTPL